MKENIPETKKMVGTTLKQAGKSKRVASSSSAIASGSGSSSSKSGMGGSFAVFRDLEPEGGSCTPTTTVMPPPSAIPKAKTGLVRSGSGTSAVSLPKTPARNAFVPFVDDSSSNPDISSMTLAPGGSLTTSRFTALRDEVGLCFLLFLLYTRADWSGLNRLHRHLHLS